MDTYNGHPSWQHWNVALWLYNDEVLYSLVKDAVKREDNTEEAAVRVLNALHMHSIVDTPDGATYTLETIKAALDEEYSQ